MSAAGLRPDACLFKTRARRGKPQTQVIQHVLAEEGKVWTSKIATNYLESKAWPPGSEEVTT